jgi:glycosyltransferase involved in cell wall biosynthesis
VKNKSLKILVVVESLDVEGSSGAKANLALIQNLKKIGFEVEVIHYTRKEISLKEISTTAVREKRRSLFFMLSRTEAFLRNHLKLPLHGIIQKRLGFSFTLLNDRNSIISFLKQFRTEDFDLLITLSQGGSFRPHHALLKLPVWHSRWLAYIHDPYPMHHYPPPYTWTEPGAAKKEAFVREISEKAAFSAFPSSLLMEWMGQFYPQFLRTGVIIPHQISQQTTINEKFPTWFNPDNFNIVHAGNLLWGRNPEGLIEGFNIFLENFPDAKTNARLIFIGGKNHYSEMLNEYSRKFPSIYNTKGHLSYNLVAAMQNSSAVNVILEAKSKISPFLPGKFPHCILAKKPILLLGPKMSESRRLLGEAYPYWAETESSERIGKIIEELYFSWASSSLSLPVNYQEIDFYLGGEYLKQVLDEIGD